MSAGYTLLVKQQQLPEQVVVLQRYVFKVGKVMLFYKREPSVRLVWLYQ